jgi:beta-xylosidase
LRGAVGDMIGVSSVTDYESGWTDLFTQAEWAHTDLRRAGEFIEMMLKDIKDIVSPIMFFGNRDIFHNHALNLKTMLLELGSES